MNLPQDFTLHLMAPPDQAAQAGGFSLPIAHMAYRVGGGPHLFCSQRPFAHRGGIMVLECQGFDGRGNPEELCREIMQECAGRGFSGVFCDFEGPLYPVLARAVERLAPLFAQRNWQLYLPEEYALRAPQTAKAVIPTALSGGSLRQRLTEAVERFGPQRVALGLERVAEDFTLPAASGSGRPLSRQDLQLLLQERCPAVYFSDELCAHYFTYMIRGQDAHFILYDDISSLLRKIRVAAGLGISQGFLPYAQADDLLPQLLEGT